MSDKEVKKKKFSITLIEIYVAALDKLVDAGVYESRGEIIQEGLRPLFRRFEIRPFAKPSEDS